MGSKTYLPCSWFSWKSFELLTSKIKQPLLLSISDHLCFCLFEVKCIILSKVFISQPDTYYAMFIMSIYYIFVDFLQMLDFLKCFFCIYWNGPMILSFVLLMWCITVLIFIFWTILAFEGQTHTWSWLMILSMCCWIWFAAILLGTFASIHLEMLTYSFLFSVVLLSGYGIRIIMAS